MTFTKVFGRTPPGETPVTVGALRETWTGGNSPLERPRSQAGVPTRTSAVHVKSRHDTRL